MASLYPRPLDVEEVPELTGTLVLAGTRMQALSGGQTQRVRLALALASDPDARPRRADGRTRRRGSPRLLGHEARLAARGKTVVFATHHLEEADAYADWVVLMAHGQVVADGPTPEIKSMVGAHSIRATLPAVGADALAALPGVTMAERHGDTVILTCSDSDATIRALLDRYDHAHDIEITGAGLEQAFVALTSDQSESVVNEDVIP